MKQAIILVKDNVARGLFLKVYGRMTELTLKGDFILSDPPDLHTAYYYATNCINELHNSGKRYAHCPFKVERKPGQVSVVYVGAATGQRIMVCHFKNLD